MSFRIEEFEEGFTVWHDGGQAQIGLSTDDICARVEWLEVPEEKQGRGIGSTTLHAAGVEASCRGASVLQGSLRTPAALACRAKAFGQEALVFSDLSSDENAMHDYGFVARRAAFIGRLLEVAEGRGEDITPHYIRVEVDLDTVLISGDSEQASSPDTI